MFISMGDTSDGVDDLYALAAKLTFTAWVGWNSSKNTNSLLFEHGVADGAQPVRPPQHPESVTLNPVKN